MPHFVNIFFLKNKNGEIPIFDKKKVCRLRGENAWEIKINILDKL